MKQNIISLLLLVIVAGMGCKKDRVDNHQNDTPPREKKGIVRTVAGDGRAFFANGAALMSAFKAPLDVAVTEDGIIYVADAINHRIRKIAGGQVFTFAGTGVGDTTSGNISVSSFKFPCQLTFDKDGNLYTLDIDDPRVRKISPGAFVSVYAGSGIDGFADGRTDTAQFGEEPSGIAIDQGGNIYVSDYENRRIRKISINGQVTTIAGNGISGFVNGKGVTAQFFSPAGIAIDKQGNLFVGDWNRIRKITPFGIVSTFVGSDSIGYRDGPPGVAMFTLINDVTIDEQENIYVSDENRIRKITPQGIVSTIAGSTAGYQDGDGDSAKFFGPAGLAIDKQGNIYVADDQNNRIRKISFE